MLSILRHPKETQEAQETTVIQKFSLHLEGFQTYILTRGHSRKVCIKILTLILAINRV
jgi:hypothetical protein